MTTSSNWREMDFSVAADRGVTIGLIALSNDCAIQPDFSRFLAAENIRVQTNRIPCPRTLDVDSLKAVKKGIGTAASNLLPGYKIDVIAFGCTAAAMVLGENVVKEQILRHHPNIAVTNPVSAALKGLARLGCNRISLLTPYVGEVNLLVEEYLRKNGLDLVRMGYFPVLDNDERSHITPDAFEAAACDLMAARDAEALFISCTALSTAGLVERLETFLNRPVITSNQALAWDAMRLAGKLSPIEGRGTLMRL